MNIFRFFGDMSHLSAMLLLVVKLHSSRSAAGVSLKMQKLKLLVFTTRYLDIFFRFISLYNTAMKTIYIALTATTIGMMRCRPSLKASYDPSLDRFRMWVHGIIPSFALTMVLFGFKYPHAQRVHWGVLPFLWLFSEVLEPLALVPQLVVFRDCTDAGRLPWLYVYLNVIYRALYVLNWVYRSYHEPRYHHDLTIYVGAAVHVGMYFVFLLDGRFRASQRAPPDYGEDIMGPTSDARERLLPGQEDNASDDDGAAGTEAVSSHARQHHGDIVDNTEGALLRERGQGHEQSSSPSAAAAAAGSAFGGAATGVGGDNSGVHLV